MAASVFLILFAITVLTCTAAHDFQTSIHLLRPRQGLGRQLVEGVDCLSWRLAVETNNLRNWQLVPESCESYVGNYMLGKQYRRDCKVVADAALEYASRLNLTGDGKDIWVFDIDETTLSNSPYYARTDVQFGALPYNATKFNEWVAEGTAPAIPAVRYLYNKLVSLGFKNVILSGTNARFQDVRAANLHKAGYRSWERLILKGDADKGLSAVAYKSKRRTELVSQGYRIVGNVGDQWSDLLGANAGSRTFKVPDPMYYIA
ncbi:acid phosphatase 1-like [Dorcoceras hygrometricum]|uniref:Acid phosphatase 1-like n=1 Tax=Dorcoceras hygrometricum TaxID=472368 RepID=A0A2Z7CP16_9LAMI|nr:acid phosphatase 1-like [Dorcoceras hygrometricum]